MQNYHIIEVKYLPATNSKPSRVGLYSPRFEKRKTIPFNYSLNNVNDMAIEYLQAEGFVILGSGQLKNGFGIITSTFETI
jgi:hypothetical protein